MSEAFESVAKRVESHHPTNAIEAALEYAWKLALYELDMGARSKVSRGLLKELQDAIAIFGDEFDVAVKGVSNVESIENHFRYLDPSSSKSSTFTEAADKFAIANARARGDRMFTRTLTNEFFRAEYDKGRGDMAINIEIAAAASVDEIVTSVQGKARELLDELTSKYGRRIVQLPEPVRSDFDSTLSRNGIHRVTNLRRPVSEIQDGDGKEYVKHVLLSPETGKAHLKLDGAEQEVVKAELRRGCVAFYRNPSNGIGEHGSQSRIKARPAATTPWHPDFIFFDKTVGGKVKPSTIDPHGEQHSDGIPKMRGLCNYAEEFGDIFSRIWCVDGSAERYVNLKDPMVRSCIREEGRIDTGEVFTTFGQPYSK